MNSNPYESPREFAAEAKTDPEQSPLRLEARRSFRKGLLILAVPTFFNYLLYDLEISSHLSGAAEWLPRLGNVTSIVVAFVVAWFFGMAIVETFVGFARSLVRPQANQSEWFAAFYRACNKLPFFTIVGAGLWFAWLIGFYIIGLNFFVLSWPIGILAHIVAACWYLPLVYRWWKTPRVVTR